MVGRAVGYITQDDFERQTLYGARRVRVYVPYGTEWYPYFMRRLAERPANVFFILRSLLLEQVR